MKKILFFGLLTCFLTIGCTKDKDSAKSATNCKITQIDEIFQGDPKIYKYYLTYDNQNRVSRMDLDKKPSTDFVTYNYQSDKITVTGQGYVDLFTLNGSGKVSKFTSGSLIVDCTYTTDGYLSKVVITNTGILITYNLTYTNNNLTKIDRKFNSNPSTTITITYGSELYKDAFGYNSGLVVYDDLLEDAGDYALISAGFFGKESKNLATGYTVSNLTQTNAITNEKDSEGNITTWKVVNSSTGTYKASFVHSCN